MLEVKSQLGSSKKIVAQSLVSEAAFLLIWLGDSLKYLSHMQTHQIPKFYHMKPTNNSKKTFKLCYKHKLFKITQLLSIQKCV